MMVRSLENRIVVKLRIGGQAEALPMPDQGLDRGFGSDFGPRPRFDQATVQRNRVEHFDLKASPDDQALDDVEAVQFGAASTQLRQIPTGQRRRPAGSPTTVQYAPTFQDSANGAHRRQRLDAALLQFTTDGFSAELAQGAVVLQVTADRQHEVFQLRRSFVGRLASTTGLIGPVDAIQALLSGAAVPILHRRTCHAKIFRDLMNRVPASHRRHHLPPTILHLGLTTASVGFLPIANTSVKSFP